jgi:hypothetical protein
VREGDVRRASAATNSPGPAGAREKEDAVATAQRVLRIIAEPINIDGQRFRYHRQHRITVSRRWRGRELPER